jgi:hypothetical protein
MDKERTTSLELSLLELYRADPVAFRQTVERRARAARSEAVHAFFARLRQAIGQQGPRRAAPPRRATEFAS